MVVESDAPKLTESMPYPGTAEYFALPLQEQIKSDLHWEDKRSGG